MLKDTHTHAQQTHTHAVNAQAGRGCEVEWHSSKPSSPYPCLFLSLNRQTILPLSPAQRNSLTASPQRHYGNQAATKAEREGERGEGGGGGGEWGYIILLDGGYVSFPSPVMRKTLILSEKRDRGREKERQGWRKRGKQ